MVGGPAGAVDLARPVLDAFSKLFSIARTMFPEVMRV
jgi:hypothetical protein